MAETNTDQQATTIRTPGPYPEGGEAIWQQFLNQYFGTPHLSEEAWGAMAEKPYGNETYEQYLETPEYPGLLQGQQDQNQFETDRWNQFKNNTLNPAYAGFTDRINQAMGAGNRYNTRMQGAIDGVNNAQQRAFQNPMGLKIGGQNFNLLQQGGINMAKDRYGMQQDRNDRLFDFESSVMPGLAAQMLTGQLTPVQADYEHDISHNPAGIQNRYIQNNLMPLATQMQGLRYGIPTQNTTGQASNSSEYGWLGTLGQGLGLLGGLGISGQDVWGGLQGLGGLAGDAFSWAGNALGGLDWGFGAGESGGGISYT